MSQFLGSEPIAYQEGLKEIDTDLDKDWNKRRNQGKVGTASAQKTFGFYLLLFVCLQKLKLNMRNNIQDIQIQHSRNCFEVNLLKEFELLVLLTEELIRKPVGGKI